MKNFTTRFSSLLIASTLFIFSAQAKSFTAVNTGKWNDANVWENKLAPTNNIEAGDVVIVKSHLILNTDLNLNGTLIVEKSFSVASTKNLIVSKNGKFVNSGNANFRSIQNEGKVDNYSQLESLGDVDNSGKVTNNVNMVTGANLYNYNGSLYGKNGTYFVNGNIRNSDKSEFSKEIKVLVADNNSISKNTTMKIEAQVIQNSVVLVVNNQHKEPVQSFTIQRSNDGVNFREIAQMNASENDISLVYQDKNLNTDFVVYKITAFYSQNVTELENTLVKLNNTDKASIR